MKIDDVDKFLDNVILWPSGCWLWSAGATSKGYAHFYVDGKTVRAHRWAYKTWVGDLIAGMFIHHKCNTIACVNPLHLEQVTPLEHNQGIKGWGGNKTHCKSGHPLSGENLIPGYVNGNRWRRCRECSRIRKRLWRKRHKEVSDA